MTAIRGQRPHRGKTVTVAEFRRMWFDASLTQADIARALDISVRALWQRARHRGMPSRHGVVPYGFKAVLDGAADAMWRACVRGEDIAAAYGVTLNAVHRRMSQKGVERGRPITRWQPAISIEDYRAAQLAEAMAKHAAATQDALRRAKMVDGPRRWAA